MTRTQDLLHLDFALKLRQYCNELGCCMALAQSQAVLKRHLFGGLIY
jgi:hypothetical protein